MARKSAVKQATHGSDIRINELNLMILDKGEREVGHKIAYDYSDTKTRIKLAIASGKVILFLPGTYDLLHAGHIVWFDQALKKFQKFLNIAREDIYVVVPFDNDKFARAVKLHNHLSQGGYELFLRPINNEKVRSIALANLPLVDLVVPTPSPMDTNSLLPKSEQIDMSHARKVLKSLKVNQNERHALENVLNSYTKMASTPDIENIKEAFIMHQFAQKSKNNLFKNTGIDSELWNIASWNLMCFLLKTSKTGKKKKIYRVVSEHDGLLKEVEFIMQLAAIETLSIKEDYITSTTRIIKDNNTRDKLEELVASSDPRNYRFS